MDIIYLRELRVETVIGIYEWERRIRQPVIIDLEMAADVRRAASTDNIDDTLNYKAVAKRVIAFVEGSQYMMSMVRAIARQLCISSSLAQAHHSTGSSSGRRNRDGLTCPPAAIPICAWS